jgi:hypothetical protein
MTLARLAVAALAVAASSRAFAGVVIEGTSKENEAPETQRIVMDGQKLRIDVKEGAVIFDGAAKRTLQLDASTKTYTEFTQADFAKLKAMMSQSDAGAKATKKLQTTHRYEKTGKSERALGKSCDIYKVIEGDGESDEELCMAPFGTFGLSREDFSGFRAMGEFTSELSGGDTQRNWADLPGVPLIAWEKDGDERVESFRATKIEKRSVPASEFSVPAGWKRNPGLAEQMEQMQKAQQQQQGTGK